MTFYWRVRNVFIAVGGTLIPVAGHGSTREGYIAVSSALPDGALPKMVILFLHGVVIFYSLISLSHEGAETDIITRQEVGYPA